ncbi:VCBS repeat-containing protein [Chryseolinea sp. H1M3-3]|uniref:VCBS repeat-containing protein n=1 Tax=Chryseolinea sp. H1M3-3 TaxID=3034144 RepID=UPI0023ED5EAC|nr:VCBS repeat-containing protein [Chryseolinea sp. H1M3-3]
MFYKSDFVSWCIVVLVATGCSTREKKHDPLFTELDADRTGIAFANTLSFDKDFNIYTYRNYYNGGGVALGDINNDGLLDVYLTGNIVPNKLFLNKGDFRFEDITEKAGVAGKRAWSTGVSMADVNGDGLVDIYVCNSGDVKGDNKQNELFINNGDLTFTERAQEYGIADRGYTTHAAFFDYDKDGDLDLYILNNSYQAIGSFNLRKNERPQRDSLGGDKLLRNDGNKFIDVSAEAGIYGSVIGFGLGVTVGDVDKDGWLDIYVSNDFFERDYLYINNHDGSFKESLTEQMKSISGASMGADLADINNDAYADIFVTEMLPKENSRLKTVTTFENWDRYNYSVQNDYYHQFTRNMLQYNNGDGSFSEIGRLAGVEATDWSWGALIFDMDNDGLKDIFVSNGIFQDLTNQDYLQYASNPEIVKNVVSGNGVDYKKLIEPIPSVPIPNFAFHNQGNLRFVDKASEWGLGEPNFSNGSAYGDLDNDGDLDLVINNVNSEASVFRNETNQRLINRYLKFELKGMGKNTSAFGTKITILHKDKTFYLEQMPIRGFESSMDPRPNIGLGKIDTVERIVVEWPDGNGELLFDVPTNQTLILEQKNGVPLQSIKLYQPEVINVDPTFTPAKDVAEFLHKENDFVDFDRDPLIYHMLSMEGPRMTMGDVNGDGRQDFYIGGAKDQPGALFIQTDNGGFKRTNEKVFVKDQAAEDMASTFFDADNDGDVDLYVCSGGNEFSNVSTALIDRLYINDGKGNFSKSNQVLPTSKFESTSTVSAADYDSDGDQDLFVGVRLLPFSYGAPMSGYILNNDGNGNFKNVTAEIAPELTNVGMITDGVWADIDGDNDYDLLIIGEYMPVKIFLNNEGKLKDRTSESGLSKSNGWWNRLEGSDLDHDGDIDFVIGNHGLNSRFRASVDQPVCMYINDFDQNGTVEQIICTYNGVTSYPMALRHDLVKQIPSLKKKYLKYENYKDQTITDIFSPEQIKQSSKLDAYEFSTSILINQGHGKFSLRPLPIEAQLSPVYGIEIADIDSDNHPDILLGGNLYKAKPEVGRYDASYGVFLKGDGKGNFKPVSSKDSGIKMDGEVRDIIYVKTEQGDLILAARNNDSILAFKKKKK